MQRKSTWFTCLIYLVLCKYTSSLPHVYTSATGCYRQISSCVVVILAWPSLYTSFMLQTQDTMHMQTGLHIPKALDEAHPNNHCDWHPLQIVLGLANRHVILLHGNTGRWLKYTDVYGEYWCWWRGWCTSVRVTVVDNLPWLSRVPYRLQCPSQNATV